MPAKAKAPAARRPATSSATHHAHPFSVAAAEDLRAIDTGHLWCLLLTHVHGVWVRFPDCTGDLGPFSREQRMDRGTAAENLTHDLTTALELARAIAALEYAHASRGESPPPGSFCLPYLGDVLAN